MSNMITRCPACATAFRITSAVLQSAKGVVRCGSCLHVFRAHDHLIITGSENSPAPTEDLIKPLAPGHRVHRPLPAIEPELAIEPEPNPAPKPVAPAATLPPSRFQLTQSDHSNERQSPQVQASNTQLLAPEEISASNIKSPIEAPEQHALARETLTSQVSTDHETDNSVKIITETLIDYPQTATSNSEESAGFFPTNNIAFNQELLAPQSPVISLQTKETDTQESVTENNKHATDALEDETFFIDEEPAPASTVSLFERQLVEATEDEKPLSIDESWADALLEDDETAHNIDEQEALAPSLSVPQANELAQQDEAALDAFFPELTSSQTEPAFEQPIAQIAPNEEKAAPNIKAPPRTRHTNTPTRSNQQSLPEADRSALLFNINPEPVTMLRQSKSINFRINRYFIWSLLMVVLLIVQIAYFQFDRLARLEPWRGYYAIACAYLPCDLPVLSNKSQITVQNLLVRKHSDIPHALTVDLILLNRAHFEQPFPELALSFSSLEGKRVAERHFAPSLYLAGELAHLSLMPQNQPLHITFDIVDPGEDAVNYQIKPH